MESSSSSSSGSPTIDPGYNEAYPPSRILYHIPCSVCHDYSSGKHYGIYACDGCAGFFKRSVRHERQYVCKSNSPGRCVVDKTHRNQCRACRLRKCFDVGMNRDAVQHERGPRNSTLMRQLSLCNEVLVNEMGIHNDLTANFSPMALPTFATNPFMMGVPMSGISRPTPNTGFYATSSFLQGPATYAPMPSNNGHMSIHEIAAELLFKNIRLMKHMGRFSELCSSDQLLLIEGCWKEVFVLSVAQYMMPLKFDSVLHSYVMERGYHHYTHQLAKDAESIEQTVNFISSLHLDPQECDFLRAIILFQKAYNERAVLTPYTQERTIATKESLREGSKIEIMYEEACANLLNYLIRIRANEMRYNEVIQIIPHLRSVPLYTIEELFFRKTIGNTTIMRLITDLYLTRKL